MVKCDLYKMYNEESFMMYDQRQILSLVFVINYNIYLIEISGNIKWDHSKVPLSCFRFNLCLLLNSCDLSCQTIKTCADILLETFGFSLEETTCNETHNSIEAKPYNLLPNMLLISNFTKCKQYRNWNHQTTRYDDNFEKKCFKLFKVKWPNMYTKSELWILDTWKPLPITRTTNMQRKDFTFMCKVYY